MVEINNLTRSYIDKKFLKRVAQIVLRGENKKENGLSIVLVGSKRIRRLNKKYRGKNRATDVLAFGQSQKFPIFSKEEIKLGEILICLQETKKNAKRLNSTFEKELARVLIHGILHLLEYDHEKAKKEAEKMEKKQHYYLSKI
jgi:probable rRNA maturation factor